MSSTLFRRSFFSLLSTSELQAGLANFHGSETWYRYILGPFTLGLYTEGVKWLADNTDCYWLLNAIFIQQNEPHNAIKKEPFQVWTLTVLADKKATLTADDGNGQVLMREEIPFTDFPMSEIVLWVEYDDQRAVLLLPSEH
ncbi:DUF6876 family protein [Adonisia turfae]|uniref:DUF6876 family protein n=1 Tax=Adonisia turfae TaxID=2950184 RepID=UPI0013D8A57B|nr:DUF6876 family protein [Adonisia turfae]